MGRELRMGLLLTVLAGGATLVGLLVLLTYAFSEVVANPGTSLVDGYWIGRLPWTAIGVDLVVIGSTLAILFGTASSWLAGGLVRRVISLVPVGLAATWWGFAAIESSIQGAPCDACGPPPFDPFSVAYSVPAQAILFLVLPAAVSAAIALSARRPKDVPTNPRTAAG